MNIHIGNFSIFLVGIGVFGQCWEWHSVPLSGPFCNQQLGAHFVVSMSGEGGHRVCASLDPFYTSFSIPSFDSEFTDLPYWPLTGQNRQPSPVL